VSDVDLATPRLTVYENEDGDYWVRVAQAPTEAEALAAVQGAWPGGHFISHGVEVVPLSDSEWGQAHLRPGRRRRAWHFEMTDAADPAATEEPRT